MDGNLDNFNTQTSNRAELDGVTLGSSNKSSRVPGNRNPYRQDENPKREMKILLVLKLNMLRLLVTNLLGGRLLKK
jgi:hypothetical protein